MFEGLLAFIFSPRSSAGALTFSIAVAVVLALTSAFYFSQVLIISIIFTSSVNEREDLQNFLDAVVFMLPLGKDENSKEGHPIPRLHQMLRMSFSLANGLAS